MLRVLSIVSAILVATTALAQTTITGTIRDAQSRQPLAGVNIMLQNPSRRAMYGYAITKEDGVFSITCNAKVDTLLVVVTGGRVCYSYSEAFAGAGHNTSPTHML